MAKKNLRIISFIAIFLTLPLMMWAAFQVTSYLSKAAPKKANIVVDTMSNDGRFTGNWLNFAQGGEEVEGMLTNTVERMKLLNPKYIRLDHIFDNYDIVGENGKYNYEKLDKTVNEISAMGAKPFFSLSYMPRQFTKSASVIDIPHDWSLWQDLVRRTIEHYSGKNNKNLKDVYYEVWNEPDLPQFGAWKVNGEKNYNSLYHYSANGAKDVQNTNNFSFGGPAVGSYYPAWVDNFVSYVLDNNLRLDFYSWHRYHTNPDKFRDDAMNIRKILNKYAKFSSLPLVLSEWGPDSENNQNSNSEKAAAHALSTIFKTVDVISKPFVFEVKDGPPPSGGKWGLLTHERDFVPLNLKPRFKAFAASTYLSGTKLTTNGWGTYIQALSSRAIDGTIYVLLTNYDSRSSNWENVPITLTGLSPGFYKKTLKNITTNSSGTAEISTADGQIKQEIIMLPNSIQLLEIKKSGNVS
ncbi:MAG TPA: glycosyl hydrolase, partial [Candidatus Dojkabacteria bacterium]|nr:glycosyl hydrolase [Candidatus Dojkabacteria bacterium]